MKNTAMDGEKMYEKHIPDKDCYPEYKKNSHNSEENNLTFIVKEDLHGFS